jgi:hypothetical protein
MTMIKVLLKNNKVITFELGDEKKEIALVTRFHNGLDGNAVLNLKTSDKGMSSRIKVSDINNMQCLKARTDKTTKTDVDSPNSPQDSKFKTREEYEKWKEQKMKENKHKSS